LPEANRRHHKRFGRNWKPLLWVARPLGLPIDIEAMSTIAVMVDFNEQAWTEICLRRSVPGPVPVWQALPVIERPTIRDLVPAARRGIFMVMIV
jgi:hypothetical protein